MKLRIKGNSLRLRLSRPEIDEFAANGRVEARITFSAMASLVYALEQDPSTQHVFATMGNQRITVYVPQAIGEAWAQTEQVGFTGNMQVTESETLSILVEKDFQCLHRDTEDERDLYPNPNQS
ncbi:DUF7009 family protein [Pontibacter sp. G13]|uniref:DUF7009 family protein n=1 Tax=Pontibacter sp. G13 TaxID=3074898 RepID=UPI00288C5053|nr:hypothetical protein [Pontibacter sp. G13]WNJ17251.1 hypothetical protein RJD25_20540 [Pontibacter sp. G13]